MGLGEQTKRVDNLANQRLNTAFNILLITLVVRFDCI